MSGPSKEPSVAIMEDKSCTTIARRPVVGPNYNVSVPCQPVQSLGLLNNNANGNTANSKSAPSVVPGHQISPVAAQPPKVQTATMSSLARSATVADKPGPEDKTVVPIKTITTTTTITNTIIATNVPAEQRLPPANGALPNTGDQSPKAASPDTPKKPEDKNGQPQRPTEKPAAEKEQPTQMVSVEEAPQNTNAPTATVDAPNVTAEAPPSKPPTVKPSSTIVPPPVQTTLTTTASMPALVPSNPAPKGAASSPSLGDNPAGTKPTGDLTGSTGPTNPGTGAVEASPNSSRQPSTGAIVGMSVGGAAALAVIALLIWFIKRRSKKRNSSLSLPADNGDYGTLPEDANATAAQRSHLGQWLPGGDGRRFTNGLNAWRSRPSNAGIARGMEERAAVPFTRANPFADGPGRQPQQPGAYTQNDYGSSRANHDMNPSNPFADSNAIRIPPPMPSLPLAAMVFDDPSQRQMTQSGGFVPPYPSRGRSLSANGRASPSPPHPAMVSRPRSVHRESVRSVDTFADKRKKFRSDPFDLEIDSQMIPSPSVPGLPQLPNLGFHSRSVSEASSRYTSGVTVSDWDSIRDGETSASSNPFADRNVPNGGKPGPASRPRQRGQKSDVVFGQAL